VTSKRLFPPRDPTRMTSGHLTRASKDTNVSILGSSLHHHTRRFIPLSHGRAEMCPPPTRPTCLMLSLCALASASAPKPELKIKCTLGHEERAYKGIQSIALLKGGAHAGSKEGACSAAHRTTSASNNNMSFQSRAHITKRQGGSHDGLC
jgi:hypothetical protein